MSFPVVRGNREVIERKQKLFLPSYCSQTSFSSQVFFLTVSDGVPRFFFPFYWFNPKRKNSNGVEILTINERKISWTPAPALTHPFTFHPFTFHPITFYCGRWISEFLFQRILESWCNFSFWGESWDFNFIFPLYIIISPQKRGHGKWILRH